MILYRNSRVYSVSDSDVREGPISFYLMKPRALRAVEI